MTFKLSEEMGKIPVDNFKTIGELFWALEAYKRKRENELKNG